MPQTSTGLPYPDEFASPNVPSDLGSLAAALDSRVPVTCTSSTRPSAVAGRIIYETNTGKTLISDGTNWLPVDTASNATKLGGKTFFVQTTQPTANAVGDVWIQY